MKLAPRFVTNDSGERTDVILSLGDYESLMEDLSDLASIADRRGEPTIPHEEFLAQLKADGILPN
jgi:hypothetical protein